MKCINCGEEDSAKFYPYNKSRCKPCLNKRSIEIYHPRRREKQSKYYKKWYKKRGRKRADNYANIIMLWRKNHPKAVSVQAKVSKAIRDKELEKPLICSICGRRGRINAHHDDYSKPFDILWVCSSCHKKIHLDLTN